jgi:hypothetical protein
MQAKRKSKTKRVDIPFREMSQLSGFFLLPCIPAIPHTLAGHFTWSQGEPPKHGEMSTSSVLWWFARATLNVAPRGQRQNSTAPAKQRNKKVVGH